MAVKLTRRRKTILIDSLLRLNKSVVAVSAGIISLRHWADSD